MKLFVYRMLLFKLLYNMLYIIRGVPHVLL